MDTRLLYTIEEAADALGISRAHMYLLLGRGELPSIQIGRSRRIPVAALQSFIEERTVQAVPTGS